MGKSKVHISGGNTSPGNRRERTEKELVDLSYFYIDLCVFNGRARYTHR
jgi:hypothetical protein